MLPKTKRLSKKDFSYKQKVFFRGNFCDIALHPTTPQKFACIVSKKISKKAVERNTITRKTYAIVGSLLQENKIPTLPSFSIYPKKTALTVEYNDYYNELSRGFATLLTTT